MEEKMMLEELEELEQVGKFIWSKKDEFLKFSQVAFESCICMLLEEYCKKHELDIVERVDEIRDVIYMVNEELGKY